MESLIRRYSSHVLHVHCQSARKQANLCFPKYKSTVLMLSWVVRDVVECFFVQEWWILSIIKLQSSVLVSWCFQYLADKFWISYSWLPSRGCPLQTVAQLMKPLHVKQIGWAQVKNKTHQGISSKVRLFKIIAQTLNVPPREACEESEAALITLNSGECLRALGRRGGRGRLKNPRPYSAGLGYYLLLPWLLSPSFEWLWWY